MSLLKKKCQTVSTVAWIRVLRKENKLKPILKNYLKKIIAKIINKLLIFSCESILPWHENIAAQRKKIRKKIYWLSSPCFLCEYTLNYNWHNDEESSKFQNDF